MSGDVRRELAEALYDGPPEEWMHTPRVDALLPVVERIAREAAAEALRPVEELAERLETGPLLIRGDYAATVIRAALRADQ